MIKTVLSLFILFCFSPDVYSQAERFEITLPARKTGHSFYNAISCLDSRPDTTSMGIVQRGPFKNQVKVVPKRNFSLQFTNVLRALTGGAGDNNKLLLQLRQLYFTEIVGGIGERGYCYLRADLYASNNDRYQIVNVVDTVIRVGTLDVTRALFRKASQKLTDFIAANLDKKPAPSAIAYTITDLKNIETIEKRNMPLYNRSTLANGLYRSYTSFANQVPDEQLAVEWKDKIVDTKEIYAIVEKGQPYINTEDGFSKAKKRDGDFFFIARGLITVEEAGEAARPGRGPLSSGARIEPGSSASFEMKLNHLNGGPIRVQEVSPYFIKQHYQ